MHKRRATGGKKKAWRKKRKCVTLFLYLFHCFSFVSCPSKFVYLNLVTSLFFYTDLPNVVASSVR